MRINLLVLSVFFLFQSHSVFADTLESAGDRSISAAIPYTSLGYENAGYANKVTATIKWSNESDSNPRLLVTYAELYRNGQTTSGASLDICDQTVPQRPKISVVFVVGDKSYKYPMYKKCRYSYQDTSPNQAFFSMRKQDGFADPESAAADPDAWSKIFPETEGGDEWYAVQVAFVDENGNWDSNLDKNYRLILK